MGIVVIVFSIYVAISWSVGVYLFLYFGMNYLFHSKNEILNTGYFIGVIVLFYLGPFLLISPIFVGMYTYTFLRSIVL